MREELTRLAEAMRAAATYRPDPDQAPVVLALPFEGSWLAVNTPARRVPSHGTHFLGQTFAIDFIAADAHRHTATARHHPSRPGRATGAHGLIRRNSPDSATAHDRRLLRTCVERGPQLLVGRSSRRKYWLRVLRRVICRGRSALA
jgi:hypothetical protein